MGQRAKHHQCRPSAEDGPSVCRSCCKGKNCWGDDKNPFVLDDQSSVADWKKDYIGDKNEQQNKNQYN